MQMTLDEVASFLRGKLSDSSAGSIRIGALRSLQAAGPTDLAFFKGDPRYLADARETRAGAVLAAGLIDGLDRVHVLVDDVGLAVLRLTGLLHERQNPTPPAGVDPTASVDPTAVVGEGVVVGAGAVVEADARIGAGSRIGALCFVGRGVELGAACVLHPGAAVLHGCRLGDRVVLWPYAVIGRDGFGFEPHGGQHLRIPQIGGVEIGNDVELGSFSSIDRGAVDPTVVEDGVKIDSHCHVAHNCHIGHHAMLIGYARMGGSVTIGPYAILAQDAAIGERRTVGEAAVVGTAAGVMYADVPDGERVQGLPARPHMRQKRIEAAWDKLPELLRDYRRLEKRVAELESGAAKSKRDD
jgi:UDP-3-O-[3-hydroxymyristoyl] glucosamine N-acyltransferase